ncbi:hypothetical protein CSUI_009893, partial [Cystoisospora suis]
MMATTPVHRMVAPTPGEGSTAREEEDTARERDAAIITSQAEKSKASEPSADDGDASAPLVQPPSPSSTGVEPRETWRGGLRNKLTKLLLASGLGEDRGGEKNIVGGKAKLTGRMSSQSHDPDGPFRTHAPGGGVMTPQEEEEMQEGEKRDDSGCSSHIATLVQNTPRGTLLVTPGEGLGRVVTSEMLLSSRSYQEADREYDRDTAIRNLHRLSAVDPQHLRSPFESRDASYQLEDTPPPGGDEEE